MALFDLDAPVPIVVVRCRSVVWPGGDGTGTTRRNNEVTDRIAAAMTEQRLRETCARALLHRRRVERRCRERSAIAWERICRIKR